MLRWRIIVAAAIIVPMLGLCWLDFAWNFGRPGVWLFPVALLVTAAAAMEMVDLLSAKPGRPKAWPTVAGTLAVVLGAGVPLLWEVYPADCRVGRLAWPLVGLAVGLLLAMACEMRRFDDKGKTVDRIAMSVFVMVYVGLLMSFVVQLRLLDGNRVGLLALFSLMFIVKLSDTGAYAIGRLLGRHKLAPKLSPGKTIEGAIGGIVFACGASMLVFLVLAPAFLDQPAVTVSWWVCLLYGLSLALAGMVGDLAESLIKRDVSRKDSSSYLPGLGGALDVLDSILVAAPVAYVWWSTQWLTPAG